jgi:hypothetical protein
MNIPANLPQDPEILYQYFELRITELLKKNNQLLQECVEFDNNPPKKEIPTFEKLSKYATEHVMSEKFFNNWRRDISKYH